MKSSKLSSLSQVVLKLITGDWESIHFMFTRFSPLFHFSPHSMENILPQGQDIELGGLLSWTSAVLASKFNLQPNHPYSRPEVANKQHNNSRKLVFISLLLLEKQIIQFFKIFWPGWELKFHRADCSSELSFPAPLLEKKRQELRQD